MTWLREDGELDLPGVPSRIPDVGTLEGGPAVLRPARAAPFLVESGCARVVGSQRGPIDEVWIGGTLIARDLNAYIGPAGNILAHPAVARRERTQRDGSTLEETIVALPSLPLVAVQWQGEALPEKITLDLLPSDAPLRGRVGPSSILVERSESGVVAVGVSPHPDMLSIDDTKAGTGRVLVRPRSARVLTLLLAAGSRNRVASAFGAGAHLAAHARQATALPDTGLAVHSGVAELDDGISFARSRLASALSRAARRGADSSDAVWPVLAAIAASDREASRAGLELAATVGTAEAAILQRAYAMAFGGDPTLAPRRVRPPGLQERRGPPRADHPVKRSSREAWIASLLLGEPTGYAPQSRSRTEGELYDLASLFRSNPDPAFSRWRQRLEGGLVAGPGGPGTWDRPDDEEALLMPATAALILALTHGLLGLSTDAPAGRIRLAPRLPEHLTRLEVEGLALGDAALSLAYVRDGPAHAFALEPTRGAIPPVAVFEPGVPGAVSSVHIDGAPVELDLLQSGTRTVVPVQLPLDGLRRVEIVVG